MGRQFTNLSRAEVIRMFKELDPKSQHLARLITIKYGNRLAARFILKTYNTRSPVTVIAPKRSGFLEFARGIYRKVRSFLVSDDPEGDSRIFMRMELQ